MITTKGLTKRFDGTLAVDALSFEVREGEVLGLLGPNGAGKTTTIRMLAGLIAPSRGAATVCGHEIGRDGAALRGRVGLLTEAPGLWGSLSAKQNLEIYARLYDVEKVGAQVEKYLRLLELWDRRNDATGTFSKGMKQKLALARALVHEPKVLFLDEPTSGLDPQMAKLVRDFIETLHGQGRTILVTTHNLDEAQRLCDRVAVIRTRLVAIDDPKMLHARLFQRGTLVRLKQVEARFVEAAGALEFVSEVRLAGEELHVALENPDENNAALVRRLVEVGADVVYVTSKEPSLEEVYLKLMQEEDEA